MAKLKFELFITYGDKQLTIVVGDQPVLLGCSENCDIRIGDGEPKIKAMIQKEGEHLNVKVFDINHPVTINNKKYKSAKIKKSVFFKIGDVDIISNVEEIGVTQAAPSLALPEEDTLPTFRDQDITKTGTDVPSLPEQTVPTLNVENVVQPKVEQNETVNDLMNDSAPVSQPVKDGQFQEDGFSFDIKFANVVVNQKPFQKYDDTTWDYNSYIELWDESVKRLPVPEIHKEKNTKSIHIVHTNNGTVLNEEYFATKQKRIFMTCNSSSKNYMQIHDCGSSKLEFIFNKGETPFVSIVDGYNVHRVCNEQVMDINESSVQLNEGQKIVLTKGTSQVIVQLSDTPPTIKTNRFFNVENDLLKSVAACWAFALLFVANLILFPPLEKDKEEKEKVVIIKRQKKELIKPLEKPKPKETKVAKQSSSSSAPKEVKQQTKTPKPPAPKQVTKTPPKPKKAPVKNAAPKKKPVKKVAESRKSAPKKATKKRVSPRAKKPAVAKAPPKKQYKFSFGSKLNSGKTSLAKTNLKVAKTASNTNVANSFSSSTSMSKGIASSSRFGQANTKVSKFNTGGRSGSSKSANAKGLSGKRGVATAYIQANTKILGALDPNLIRKLMREFIPEFRRCYQRELVKNPKVAGVFDLAFQINGRGKGTNVRVKSNGKGFSKKGKTCLKRVVSLIKFPKPKGGGLVDVKQPMNFYNQ